MIRKGKRLLTAQSNSNNGKSQADSSKWASYEIKKWDNQRPTQDYWDELKRVSKNQVLGNAVKNALKKQYLETQLEGAVKQLQQDMGFDKEGGGSFDGLTPEEQQRFKDRVNSIAQCLVLLV